MINELLAIKITRHDFGVENNVGSTGFFPAKIIKHNDGQLILRQADVFKLVQNNKSHYFFVKFITKEGYYRLPVLAPINDIIKTEEALVNDTYVKGFELFNATKEIEYIGNFIEDDIQTILNNIENRTQGYLYRSVFESLSLNYFYNYFDKPVQDMLFHLSFTDVVFMLKDFEKIILENDRIAQQLDLRKVKYFPVYPFYNLHDCDGNKRPIHTTLNSVLTVQDNSYLSLLNNEGYIRFYDLINNEVILPYKISNMVKSIVDEYNEIDITKYTFENLCFSTNCVDYIYQIHSLDFEKINKSINE